MLPGRPVSGAIRGVGVPAEGVRVPLSPRVSSLADSREGGFSWGGSAAIMAGGVAMCGSGDAQPLRDLIGAMHSKMLLAALRRHRGVAEG